MSGCQDDSFGPYAGQDCRGGFDFTLLFEEAVLTIPLQCLLLLILPWRVLHLLRLHARVSSGFLRPLKLAAALCLIGLSAGQVIFWTKASSEITTNASIPTAALLLAASVGVCVLSYLDHERSVRPSFILFTYLFLSALLGLPRLRTTWMTSSDTTLPILMTCSQALKVFMLVLESVEKRGLIKDGLVYSFEATSSTLSRSVFFWLVPLFRIGFRKTIALEDLYPLDERLKGAPLYNMFAEAWDKVPNQETPGALMSTWMGAFGKSIMAPIIPRLCMMAFVYAQPFLIKQAIGLALFPTTQEYDNWGYGLIGAFVIVYGGLAVASGQYMWRVRRTGAKLRGALFGLIYQKSLRLEITSPNVSPMAGITLIGTDVETIIVGMNMIHELWASVVEIGIATWLIYRELGAACAMPIALAIVNLIAAIFVSMPIGRAQANWIQASQERVTTTSKTLNSIKRLRISGLNDLAFSIVRNLRTVELAKSTKYRYLLGISLILVIFLPLWSPILTFATWAGVAKSHNNDTLSLGKVFASYLFIVLLATPLTQILIALPSFAGAMACFQRVQNHLVGKERQDNRLPSARQQESLSGRVQRKGASDSAGSGSDEKAIFEFIEKPSPQPSTSSLNETTIAIVRGSFSWTGSDEPVINIAEWTVERGSFSFITGPVGCGKSTLLKALLGELSAFQGTIQTNYTGVAYCDQTPWIPNETVRNIITGHSSLDEQWYYAVIHACVLEPDLASWSHGDQTLAGTQGISFSGGQKQRLAIARAIYARKEFLIFDDVLSGLDAETEDKVFNRVFGKNGLIRRANMTVVCATSSVARIRQADKITQLNERGEVINEGTPDELLEPLDDDDAQTITSDDLETDIQRTVTFAAIPDEDDEPEEDNTRRLGDSSMYGFYARAAGRHTLVVLAICMAIYAFCQAFPTLWIGWWAGADRPLDNLGKWLGVYVALGVGAILSIGLGLWSLLIRVINRAGMRFHDNLVDTVSKAPMSFHSTVDSGVTVNRFSQDLRLIDMELPQALFSVTTTTAGGIAQFVLICVVAKYMAAFLPVLAIIVYLIQFVYLRTSRQLRLLDIEQTAPLYTQLIETLNGLTTIRAFQWERQCEEKNMRLINNSQRPFYLLASVQSWLGFVTDIFVAVIAMVFAVLATTLREEIGADMIGTGLSNILAFSNSMKAFVTYWVALETALGAVSRVRRFTETTASEGSDDQYPEDEPKEHQWPTRGAVEIQNITASYTSVGPVLKNVSLSIKAGERIAICGRTGSGKSSLTLCLLRMMNLDTGSIRIDGVDLHSLPHEFVRTNLVALPQDSYVFDGTVRLNVDPDKASTDERIVEVLKKVQLWSKIEARGGLDNIIGDDFFSPGESQLLVFARALLRDSKILILDEFTSSLDTKSTTIVEGILDSTFKHWTIIAIAHKLHSIVDFDKVAVLDAGRVVEYGVPRELLTRDSWFTNMYNSASQR